MKSATVTGINGAREIRLRRQLAQLQQDLTTLADGGGAQAMLRLISEFRAELAEQAAQVRTRREPTTLDAGA